MIYFYYILREILRIDCESLATWYEIDSSKRRTTSAKITSRGRHCDGAHKVASPGTDTHLVSQSSVTKRIRANTNRLKEFFWRENCLGKRREIPEDGSDGVTSDKGQTATGRRQSAAVKKGHPNLVGRPNSELLSHEFPSRGGDPQNCCQGTHSERRNAEK